MHQLFSWTAAKYRFEIIKLLFLL